MSHILLVMAGGAIGATSRFLTSIAALRALPIERGVAA